MASEERVWGKLWVQPTIPDSADDTLIVGSLWSDSNGAALYVCTSVSPITFVDVTGTGSATVAWGDITGTLSAQSDLNSALAGKQPLDTELTALAGVAAGADKLPYFTATTTATVTDFPTAARNLLTCISTSAQRTALGLAIGVNVQAFDSDLASIASLTTLTFGRSLLTLADGSELTSLLNTFTSSQNGVVPASGGGTTNFLRADGAFAEPPGTGGGGLSVMQARAIASLRV